MPPKSRSAGPKKGTRRRDKKNVPHGHAHIKSTFNNTIVSISDPNGNVISWASSGHVGFKGSRKSTPFASGGGITVSADGTKALLGGPGGVLVGAAENHSPAHAGAGQDGGEAIAPMAPAPSRRVGLGGPPHLADRDDDLPGRSPWPGLRQVHDAALRRRRAPPA